LKRAIVSVINDLSTDQRVHRHCVLLGKKGYDVLLIGRSTSVSRPLETRTYAMHRMKLPFERGPWFYASFNIGLFFQLLFRRTDLLFANDLDTLLPNYLISRAKRIALIYDSHEFFTEVPELTGRPTVQRIWQRLEAWLLPDLKYTLTVNASIARLYREKFGIEMKVLRNIPTLAELETSMTRAQLNLPTDRKLIILQGAGINMHRGAEEAVEAMAYMEDAVLLILGSGDVIPKLKERVSELEIGHKVLFKERMPYAQMMAHTRLADLGLSLDRDTNINYRYSLPNKLFDYIHAGIPVLASDLVEVRAIVEEFQVGEIVTSYEPKELAIQFQRMLNSNHREEWKQNALKAREVLNYETESRELLNMIDGLNE
jgi:glycosyltransferase involved in cell wall biosynthesis